MILYCFLAGLVFASGYCNAQMSFNTSLNITLIMLSNRIKVLEKELEHGGRQIQSLSLNSSVQLNDHDYLRLQFLGARRAWLGCPSSDEIYGLRTCPSSHNNYRHFDQCVGTVFQIIGKGTTSQSHHIKSGQRIRLRYINEHNTWIGCPFNSRCDKRTCPGTNIQASNFNTCYGEIFRIFARGKTNGQTIYNGDVVMLYYEYNLRYVSIQGQNEGDETSLDFCPGEVPPAYLSYGICSKNAFRIYRKP